MSYLAAVEVDQRQRIITSADKLKEMLGGSWTIQDTEALGNRIPEGIDTIKSASGDLWFKADDLSTLTNFLWTLRREIVDRLNLPCSFAIHLETGQAQEDRLALTRQMKRIKASKSGEVGHISLPWCAPCQIQPNLVANYWYPNRENHDQLKRRALISANSKARLKRGRKTMEEYYRAFPIIDRRNLEYPDSLNDFAPDSDSYLAVLRFDADGATKFFEKLELDNGWNNFKECSTAMQQCLETAMNEAFNSTIEIAKFTPKNRKVPISPLIAAGDDFLVVIRRDLALPFALALLEEYTQATSRSEILKAHTPADDTLTLSGAIVFARAGFPFSKSRTISKDRPKTSERRPTSRSHASMSTGSNLPAARLRYPPEKQP